MPPAISLPNAPPGCEVVTRFPPEPSWVLDLGHCKASLINQLIATQFKGKWLLRFDDTNPKTCSQQHVASYLQDLPLLGLQPDRVSYASDHFSQMIHTATGLIEAGFLYADDTPTEEMRAQRLAKQPSPQRDRSTQDNLAAWSEMQQAGTDAGQRFCLRFKLQPLSENGALRDPVAWRVIDTPHYKTGTRFCVYPTYDFAVSWLDLAEGVTHALRTCQFRDRDVLYSAVQQAILKLHPEWVASSIYEFPRIHMAYTPQLKAHQKALVAAGLVEGPSDPRLPTLRGLMRAGCHPDALKAFLLEQVTPARKETHHSWDKVWTLNRRLLDPTAARHMAVADEGRVLLTLLEGPSEPKAVDVLWKQGHVVQVVPYKQVWIDQEDAQALSEGDEVTLLAWGNAVVQSTTRADSQQQQQQQPGAAGKPCEPPPVGCSSNTSSSSAPQGSRTVTHISAALNLAGSPKDSTAKLHWLPALPDDQLVPLRLVRFSHPVLVERVTEEVDVVAHFHHNSRVESRAWGDASLLTSAQPGNVVQLQRKGFYIVDQVMLRRPGSGAGGAAAVPVPVGAEAARQRQQQQVPLAADVQEVVLFYIPDGHTKNEARV